MEKPNIKKSKWKLSRQYGKLIMFGVGCAILAVGYLIGAVLHVDNLPESTRKADVSADVHDHSGTQSPAAKPVSAETIYTCPMHPQILRNKPGKCPICGMDLVIRAEAAGTGEYVMSEAAVKLAEIQTTPVEKKFVAAKVRLVGKVALDETRVKNITARFPGRLDRLYVDYTGVPVKKNEHLVEIYSPDLLTAQQELLQAKKSFDELPADTNKSLRDVIKSTLGAAREKLRLWDLGKEQIAEIEKLQQPSDSMTINAPLGGIVIAKHAVEGSYIKTGMPIYTIADLSRLWVKIDAYESDMRWLHFGQNVDFEVEAFPGKTFSGKISFIDPVLDPKTRTVKLRVNVDNAESLLKPEMFVRATISVTVGDGGRIITASLKGKWICPMHPEVISDTTGSCRICGMALAAAEKLGLAGGITPEAGLVIPASAALITGKRAIVYVRKSQEKGAMPTFEGREVILAGRAGGYYLVKSGLAEGELVVTNGNFKIDSAMQISQSSSMMNPAKTQTVCPVMGGKINKKLFADHNGLRVYFCCEGCSAEFTKDPEKYISKMRRLGIEPEKKGAGGSKPEEHHHER